MHSRGIDPVLRHVDIKYLSPLGLGDSMVSRLAVARRGPLFVFVQDIYTPDGRPVVKATIEVATLENGRLTRGDVLFEAFKQYL